MARRTPEQNRAIYQRRAERARQKGAGTKLDTYSKQRRAAEKANDKAKVLALFQDLGATKKQAEARLQEKGWTQHLLHEVARGGVDYIQRNAAKNPLLWYHFQ